MSDRLAFLRAIRASPDDDTARLAFADWLDDRDDPLGAFVRVQVELEPVRYRIDNPRAVELHRREDELLRRHGDDWIGTDALLTHPSDFGPVFRRGLPDYACLSLDTFLKNGAALFAAHPTLREVALYGVANRCDELTLCPLLANLDTLEIADWPTEQDAAALAASPHLQRIARFKVWAGPEPHWLRALVNGPGGGGRRGIELVQVWGGAICCDPEHARALNHVVDAFAAEANARLGRPVVRVTRPFEELFPVAGDAGRNVVAGRLPDGRPALAAGSFVNWVRVAFTGDGRVQDVAVRDSPVCASQDARRYGDDHFRLGAAFEEWVHEGLRLEPGVIRVREFSAEDLSVVLWPWRLREALANTGPVPPPRSGSEEDWRGRGGDARGWLERRNFVINWHSDYRADWRGTVRSS